uniref:Protein kinase domain-containing protein n=1 Tax=Quercus lobata TaxID=97700 RepID=A0A7N2LD94_QUELO
MESFSFYTLSIALFLCLFYDTAHCQQAYLNNSQLNCTGDPFISKGYLCNRPLQSCKSYVTFRSQPSYETAKSIADLLGSEASLIASINNVSNIFDSIPADKLTTVPITCLCSGTIYQYYAHYTAKKSDTYFHIANDTYQGLTTCQALTGQNYYNSEDIPVGTELTVPVRCACPTENQTENGVISLLDYMVKRNHTVLSIAKAFGFFCDCPNGYAADGVSCKTDPRKLPVKWIALLGIGIGVGFLCLFLLGYKLYQFLKKRKDRIHKEKLFKQNGGFLLQEKFSSCGSSEKAKIFTAEEPQRATDSYNKSRFLGQGGYGTVYKGMLPDGNIVAVKKSKGINKSQIEQFINEVVILSQINHRNIVKVLGCCLETDYPLLVYEFIPNGTLSQHIHWQKDLELSLSWENRIRIACEVAGAVAYMHGAASIPILHRDIKSSNILLDDKYAAKESDFGTSRAVPDDKTHLTTKVKGTLGYLDPEYFQSSQFTDKSDVYSFGVVLVELLTGKKPISFVRDEEERNLVSHFIALTKEDRLHQILQPQVAREASRKDIHAIANLAMRCLRLNGKKRPSMKEVSMELEALRISQKCFENFQEPHLLKDEVSSIGSTRESQESSEVFSLIGSTESLHRS